MNRDLKMIINEETKKVYIFNIIFFDNMPQQTNNKDFL